MSYAVREEEREEEVDGVVEESEAEEVTQRIDSREKKTDSSKRDSDDDSWLYECSVTAD